MAKAMTKSQIMTKLAETTGLKKKEILGVIEAMVALAYKEAKNAFTIPGLGKLVVRDRKARVGRNPATGAPIDIPAKKVLKFLIAKAAKDACVPKKN
jgi:DNA-binding protein HU-beta